MAYTGTGTNADPYIVDNLVDLRTCANMQNKYVHLDPNHDTKIMDLSDFGDIDYLFNINNNTHVYGNGWTIKNAHITTCQLIRMYTNSCVSDMNIIQTVMESARVGPTGANTASKGNVIGFYSSSHYNCHLENCNVSILMKAHSYNMIMEGVYLTNCNMYFKIGNSGSYNNHILKLDTDNGRISRYNNIELHNVKVHTDCNGTTRVNGGSPQSTCTSVQLFEGNIKTSLMYGDITCINLKSAETSDNFIHLIHPTNGLSTSDMLYALKISAYNSNDGYTWEPSIVLPATISNSYIVTEMDDDQFTGAVIGNDMYDDDNNRVITYSNVKSEDYLISIGFLP